MHHLLFKLPAMLPPNENTKVAAKILTAAVGFTFFCGAMWAIWVVRMFRRDRHRLENHCCLNCGYDLRYTKDRCPECGQVIERQTRAER